MLIKERKDPMTKYDGYMGKVLTIDLKDKTTSLYPWSEEDRQLYLGGKIMAAKIISDNVKPCVDAFHEENILIISTGPLTGTNAPPASSRFNISTISPLTGLLTIIKLWWKFWNCFERAGLRCIDNKKINQSLHIWIEITEDEVFFHDAIDLWGARLPVRLNRL